MNWARAAIAGVAGGLVMNIANYVMHGMIMAQTYKDRAQLFSQEEPNIIWFFLIAFAIGIAAAILYAKSFTCWGGGWKGGAIFGCFLGLVFFFPPFYNSLVLNGWPYFLSWCWGGINLIGMVILGTIIGAVYKQ